MPPYEGVPSPDRRAGTTFLERVTLSAVEGSPRGKFAFRPNPDLDGALVTRLESSSLLALNNFGKVVVLEPGVVRSMCLSSKSIAPDPEPLVN